MARASGGLAGLMALLGGGTFLLTTPPQQLVDLPVVKVNYDDSLMAHWPSEELGADADEGPECSCRRRPREPWHALKSARRSWAPSACYRPRWGWVCPRPF